MDSLDPQQPQEPEARPVPRVVLIVFGLAALVLAGALLFYAYGRFAANQTGDAPLESIPAFSGTTESGVASVQTSLDGLPEVGDLAPDFELSTLSGDTMRLSDHVGRPVILNFWATWCAPCIEEMPLLDRFYTENRANDWQVLGLAVDQAAPVTRFLERMPMQFPIALAGFAGIDLSRKLGNTGGGLPFSVLIDSSSRIKQRKIGQLSAQDLQQWQNLR